MSRRALPMPSPITIMSLRTLQCLACGWSLLRAFAVERKSADAHGERTEHSTV